MSETYSASAELGRALATLCSLPTATIYEAAGKCGAVGPSIHPIGEGLRLGGVVFTVKAEPSDNLVLFRAVDAAVPGSVLVIEAGATDQATIWGGTLTTACVAKGILGCVTNAAVRDVAQIRKLKFPVFAAGVNVSGTVKRHAGWTQIPISIGNAVVKPGDLVFGDEDGVVFVAAELAVAVAKSAMEKARTDEDCEDRLRRGESLKQVFAY